ncbi:MAG: NUDIX hydrolase [Bacteroidaceae bacterium]|nr:NUDIX hydrolase [Bacteroidaceae bacterium]
MSPSYYSLYPKFHVAVDCIIFGFRQGSLQLLLQKRPFEPRQGEWSLMGGFVKNDEDLDAAAHRVLNELTGIHNVYMEQVGAFGSVHRDSGNRVISVAYYALLNMDKVDNALSHVHSAYWENVSTLPKLLFDHREMVEMALHKLRGRIQRQPVGFQMLPSLFTLTQLQQLYEAILGEPLDKRNFRKRVYEMPFIEKTPEVDKQTSKRGAALFRFNDLEYRKELIFKL